MLSGLSLLAGQALRQSGERVEPVVERQAVSRV
jgi:hypothetical protein